MAKDTRKIREANTVVLGTQNINPAIGVSICKVEFPGGDTNELESNIIAESILLEINSEGKQYHIINEIVDHKRNGRAIRKKDSFIFSKNRNKYAKRTTAGWYLQVK